MTEYDDHVVEEIVVIGGIEGKNLDHLARELVSGFEPQILKQRCLRYILEQALHHLDTELSGKGVE